MRAKRILRFYFSAEGIERHIDELILKRACDFGGEGADIAEEICGLIGEKLALSGLWKYLDEVILKLTEDERNYLMYYAYLREGLKSQTTDVYRITRSTVTKFTRRARRLSSFFEAYRLVDKYYYIM